MDHPATIIMVLRVVTEVDISKDLSKEAGDQVLLYRFLLRLMSPHVIHSHLGFFGGSGGQQPPKKSGPGMGTALVAG